MKKYNGGYQIIDCGGLDMTDSNEQTITGLFKKAKKAVEDGKPVFASNTVWGSNSDAPLTPLSVFLQQWNADLIVATCSTKSVRITKADKCTVVDLVNQG